MKTRTKGATMNKNNEFNKRKKMYNNEHEHNNKTRTKGATMNTTNEYNNKTRTKGATMNNLRNKKSIYHNDREHRIQQ